MPPVGRDVRIDEYARLLVDRSVGVQPGWQVLVRGSHLGRPLLEAVMESTGEMLWQVIRSFEESLMLLNHMGNHLKQAGDLDRAETFYSKARELEKRSRTFHVAAIQHESLSGDNLGQQPED